MLIKDSYEPWTDSLDKQHKGWNVDMRFGTWNKSMYRRSLPMLVSKELSKYNLDFVGEQQVRWEGSDTEPAREHIFQCKEE
jgi:hypothetical protein